MIQKIFFLLFLSTPLLLNATALIEQIKIKGNNVVGNTLIIQPNADFKEQFLTQDFFVKYGDGIDFSSMHESVLVLPFIGSIIHIIWASGQTYTIDIMDEDFFYSLEKIKEVFKFFYPTTDWSGELIPQKLIKNTGLFSPNKVAVLFSGGLDAVATSFSHSDQQQLLITIRGRDVKLNQDTMWTQVKKQSTTFAQQYNHSITFLASNFHECINHQALKKKFPSMPYWGDTSQSLAFAGLTAPLLVHNKIKEIFMASSNTIECPFPYGSHPLIDNNINLSGIQFHYDRPDLTRIDKLECIKTITDKLGLPKPKLRVCWGNDKLGGNCYTCEKCIRTMNLILALGENLHDYGFYQTLEDVQKITHNYFSPNKKRFLKFEVAWDWECIQDRIKKIMNDPLSIIHYTEELHQYLDWFCSISLDSFCYDQRQKFEDNKEKFMPLWALAEHGPISIKTIQHMTSSNIKGAE